MTPAGRARADEGAEAVEFALISPVLFLLLFGIIQYGVFFFQVMAAERAAAAGADLVRTGFPGVVTTTDPSGCEWWRQRLAAGTSAPGIDAAGATWQPEPASLTQVQAYDTVVVSVPWQPVRLAGGLIPVPGGTTATAVVETTVTHPGTTSSYTVNGSLGCS